MKILITGASGKLGAAVTSALLQSHELVLLARDNSFVMPGTAVYHADLENIEALETVFESEKPDIVIHLASVIGPACESNPDLAKSVNVTSTKELAKLARHHGVKQFLFTSTAAVYHQEVLDATDEDSNIAPRSIYGATKLEAEGILKDIAEGSSTKYIVFRIFNLYGPRFNSSLINRLVQSNNGEAVQLYGYEKFFRDYIHVDDAIKVLTNFEKMSELSNYHVFNIASGRALSNGELISEIKQTGLEVHYSVVGDQESFSWANIDRVRHQLDFLPSATLRLDI